MPSTLHLPHPVVVVDLEECDSQEVNFKLHKANKKKEQP